MSIQSKTTLKGYFETGDKPTETEFGHLIDTSAGRTVVPLSYASTLATDCTTGHIFKVTVTGAMEIGNPTGAIDGTTYMWMVKQGGAGSYAITLGNKFKLPASASSLAWSTDVGAMDIFAAQYDSDADLFYVVSMIPGY